MKLMHISKPSFSVSSIKKPRINKTAVLVTLAVLLVLITFAYGAVRSEQKTNHDAQVAADNANKQAADDKAQADRIKTLEAEVSAANANTTQVCTYVKSLAAQKALVRVVTVPASCIAKI